MFWALCVRLDLPLDAARDEAHAAASVLSGILDALDRVVTGRLNLALSAGALRALVRYGREPLLGRVLALAADRRIEFLSTAAHGALLPLLPEDEIDRQLTLNWDANFDRFGDLYSPSALWPPFLATSPKVADVAARHDFTTLLVDETAMRQWPAPWPGQRIDSVEEIPCLFALPVSRARSRDLAEGTLHTRLEMRHVAHGLEGRTRKSYVVTAFDIAPRRPAPHSLALALEALPTVRYPELYNHFPTTHVVSLLPSSSLSTAAQLGHGLPFAPWFSPDNPRQRLQWRLVSKVHDALRSLESAGLQPLPEVRGLRATLDLAWRESWWRVPEELDPGLMRLEQALSEVAPMLPPARVDELRALDRDLRGQEATGAQAPP